MGELIAPIVIGAGTAAIASKVAPKPRSISTPPVPQTIQAPDATRDVTEAKEQSRRGRTTGRQETVITGDLVPKTKKKTLLG